MFVPITIAGFSDSETMTGFASAFANLMDSGIISLLLCSLLHLRIFIQPLQ
jgi:hypothetical protein